jgi:hypothetical protein
MRTLTILIAAFTFCCKTLGQTNQGNTFTTFIIDTTLNSTLAKAKLKSEFNLPMVADGFWYFIDKKNFKEFVSKTGDPTTFFDTLQTLTNVVCDCMIKKDTIYLQGGIAYGGGMGLT